MKKIIHTIVPFLLIILFTYAAASKLMDVNRFRSQLYLQPFSHGIADVLLYVLPTGELLLATMLCFNRTRFTGLLLSTLLMAAFTAYISMILLHYWGKVPCSCGGILENMSWPVHLAFNWAFLLAGVTAIILQLSGNKREQNDLI
ncbi:MauE/DoxX family redox-associated membrane protein [Mucilaginibacter sp. FT3.2]|uniref:MauE/DoxX family redox-associated membrane protein n=1 Tax=Mucilaginibacter sp. FT3.2 TaxID=2723090 RepID=UPI00161F45E2|nr:MauE/DoxX family redox-associated membrane protein [Mucilaginibacter sp. FT3.2]MBB6234199.1 putative membrane protein [Mucilaginibacter sp. FT3.2]